jgi:hypothetical protein
MNNCGIGLSKILLKRVPGTTGEKYKSQFFVLHCAIHANRRVQDIAGHNMCSCRHGFSNYVSDSEKILARGSVSRPLGDSVLEQNAVSNGILL